MRQPSRAPRSDGVRNRAHLVRVASIAFRDEGFDVGVDEIAKRAEVSVATLYRHFATKDALIVAVSGALIEQLTVVRDDALAGDANDALQRFLRAAMAQLAANRGLVQALAERPPNSAVRHEAREQAISLLAPLAARARESGELSDDLDAEDLLVVLRMLGAVAGSSRSDDPDRYLRIMLPGLRLAEPGRIAR
ncbi:MAG TPA: helix-turn-helix domain-containing protein [Conexibacter sp.]|jgi:AcrR family transcriptional regulator